MSADGAAAHSMQTLAGTSGAGVSDLAVRGKPRWNARPALIGLGVLAAILGILALRSFVSATKPSAPTAESSAADEQVIVLGGEAVSFPAGTVGNKIGSWLNRETSGANAFFVEDELFVSRSTTLTAEAEARLDRLVKLLTSNDDLSARLFVTTYEGTDDARKANLALSRSQHLRAQMIARGVPPRQVTTDVTPLLARAANGNGPRPTVVIVLSRHGEPASRSLPDRRGRP